MRIEWVPSLALQRDLYRMPRDELRFQAYLAAMRGGGDDIELPLVAFNPMGRDHVATALDRLLALDADRIAAEAAERVADDLRHLDHTYRATLVVSDDIGGLWTYRPSTEFVRRWGDDALLDRGWLVPLAWTSDTPTRDSLEREVRSVVGRAAYRAVFGPPQTVGDTLRQEGGVLLLAGGDPGADEAALARLLPHLEARDTATVFAALLGDDAAIAMGYAPLGVSATEAGGAAIAYATAVLSPEG